jgi:hypothetical protein
MKTVTFDEATHAVVPIKLTDNMIQVYNQSVANWEGFIPAIEKLLQQHRHTNLLKSTILVGYL